MKRVDERYRIGEDLRAEMSEQRSGAAGRRRGGVRGEARPAADCPIQKDAMAVIRPARECSKALRRLRRRLDLCKSCVNGRDCPLIREWNCRIRQAIEEISEE